MVHVRCEKNRLVVETVDKDEMLRRLQYRIKSDCLREKDIEQSIEMLNEQYKQRLNYER